MFVGDLCTKDVDVVRESDSVRVAAERMHDHKVGSLVVVNRRHKPVGIITDRDLAVRVLALGREPNETTVDEVMTQCPKTLRSDSSVDEALLAMRAGPFRRLPVVDEEGDLAGLLSLDDVLTYLVSLFSQVRTVLEEESPQSLALCE